MLENLRSLISEFPNQQHVNDVCKPGEGGATCRYLVVGQRGFECEKYGSLRRILDNRVEKGEMAAKGDNCGGILGLIVEHQDQLVQNKVHYHEIEPTVSARGSFEGVSVESGYLKIESDWEEKESFDWVLRSEDVLVEAGPGGISFSIRGLGSFAGTTSVSFEKSR